MGLRSTLRRTYIRRSRCIYHRLFYTAFTSNIYVPINDSTDPFASSRNKGHRPHAHTKSRGCQPGNLTSQPIPTQTNAPNYYRRQNATNERAFATDDTVHLGNRTGDAFWILPNIHTNVFGPQAGLQGNNLMS